MVMKVGSPVLHFRLKYANRLDNFFIPIAHRAFQISHGAA